MFFIDGVQLQTEITGSCMLVKAKQIAVPMTRGGLQTCNL